MDERALFIAALKDAGEVFRQVSKKTRVLGALNWGPRTARDFFKSNESALPKPDYEIDRKLLDESRDLLKSLTPKLKGQHPVFEWLRRSQESYLDAIQLLHHIETPKFFEIATKMYGNSRTPVFRGQTTHLELSRTIAPRLSVCSLNDIAESRRTYTARDFATAVEERIRRRHPRMAVEVEVEHDVVAKVTAGMNRVKIRSDATFSKIELKALWNHEVESHCLTAHNGNRQENASFLASGGPRTTKTQEGLAVFYELYGHAMSQSRFLAICNRVEAVEQVTAGADFLELYRWYRERTDNKHEAFYATQRIFRGASVTGKFPFTKDVVYLSGLLEIYHFLRAATKTQNRLLVESLLCGRIALEDVGTIAWLRSHGILQPPHFVPEWLKNWEVLMSYFAFSGVLTGVDFTGFQEHFERYAHFEDWDLSL